MKKFYKFYRENSKTCFINGFQYYTEHRFWQPNEFLSAAGYAPSTKYQVIALIHGRTQCLEQTTKIDLLEHNPPRVFLVHEGSEQFSFSLNGIYSSWGKNSITGFEIISTHSAYTFEKIFQIREDGTEKEIFEDTRVELSKRDSVKFITKISRD